MLEKYSEGFYFSGGQKEVYRLFLYTTSVSFFNGSIYPMAGILEFHEDPMYKRSSFNGIFAPASWMDSARLCYVRDVFLEDHRCVWMSCICSIRAIIVKGTPYTFVNEKMDIRSKLYGN